MTQDRVRGRALVATTLAVTLAVASPRTAAGQVPLAGLERELAADVARDSVGSIAAAVFEDGEVLWRSAFGWRERGSRALATPGTIYRAGSITKTVTALVLLRLVESGVVGLDDAVAQHLPEIRRLDGREPGAPAITFRDLATHRAGLARESEPRVHGRGPFREWKRKTVAAIPDTRVLDPPGARYRYSNIGYALLGFALERAADRPFEILADSLVFRPLGMSATYFVLPRHERGRLATGYVNPPGDIVDPRVPRREHRGRGYRVPGEGLYSTVDDLSRLGMALTGARPLLPDSLRRLMVSDARLADGGRGGVRGAGYGIGVQLIDVAGACLAGHSGTVPGYSAFLLVDPETKTGVVLLRNYNHGTTNPGAAATRLLLDLRELRRPPLPRGGAGAYLSGSRCGDRESQALNREDR